MDKWRWNYIDTHAHLNLKAFADDRFAVVRACAEKEVAIINVGTKFSTSRLAVDIAEKHAGAWAIVGLHPIQTVPGHHDEEEVGEGGAPFTTQGEVFDAELFRALALSSDAVVGIGECGFDYYHCPKESYSAQEAAFLAQIALANELSLPLMIHTREPKPGETGPTGRSAYDDVYALLERHAKVPGNVHFFAGSYEQAKRFFDIGFSVSFTGVITFAAVYEEVVRASPLSLIHAETDCPYVAPVPYRGRRAEPWHVIEVVKKIAAIKGLPVPAVAEALGENARALYRLS